MPGRAEMDDYLRVLFDTARAREMFNRSEVNRRLGQVGLIMTWTTSALFFSLGILVGNPDFNFETKAMLTTGIFGTFSLLLTAAYEVISKPRAALEIWTAVRYQGLQQYALLTRVPAEFFREVMNKIDRDLASWRKQGDWAKYVGIVRRARREGKAGGDYSTRNADELLQFALGDVGGPWDFVS